MGKLFSIWLVIAVLGWGGAAGAEHWRLTQEPHRLAVVLDSSYPMAIDWDRALELVRQLDHARYTVFAAFTEKGLVHSWSNELNFSRVTPYAPRDRERLGKLVQAPELAKAEQILYVTSDPAPVVPAGWEIVTVQ